MYHNRFLTSILFGLVVIFALSNIAMSALNDNINKQVDILNSKLQETESTIEVIRDQIQYYENEKNKLDNILASQKNDIKNISHRLENVDTAVKDDDNPDIHLLARLLESESGNQPYEGKLAVGTVVMNRVASEEFPDTIKDVIFQKRQFSVVSDGSINNKPSDESLKAAKEIINGRRVLDSNVLYFYNPKLTDKDNWVVDRSIEKIIGDHAFAV